MLEAWTSPGPRTYAEQRCSYYRYHDDGVWKQRRDGCEEGHPDTTVPPNINASVFTTLHKLMFHAKETPDCAKVCGDVSLSHTENGHETPSLQNQPLPDATKLFLFDLCNKKYFLFPKSSF